MKKTKEKKDQDIPLPLTLAILAAVLIVLSGKLDVARIEQLFLSIETVIESFPTMLCVGLIAASINLAWFSGVVKRSISLTKQGSRLKSLTGEKKSFGKQFFRNICISSFIGGAAFAICYFIPLASTSSVHLSRYEREIWEIVSFICSINIAFGTSISAFLLLKANYRQMFFGNGGKCRLPPFPSAPNSITIGAIYEE